LPSSDAKRSPGGTGCRGTASSVTAFRRGGSTPWRAAANRRWWRSVAVESAQRLVDEVSALGLDHQVIALTSLALRVRGGSGLAAADDHRPGEGPSLVARVAVIAVVVLGPLIDHFGPGLVLSPREPRGSPAGHEAASGGRTSSCLGRPGREPVAASQRDVGRPRKYVGRVAERWWCQRVSMRASIVPNADRDCRRCHRGGMTDDTPARGDRR
jgi:hypothetical protein